MVMITVFLGSRDGTRPHYAEVAASLGNAIAAAGWGLTYGGAGVGTMRSLADAALARGGHVTGIMPADLIQREVGHAGLSAFLTVGSMAERKARLAANSDGYFVLPGGFGTLDEAFEVLTAAQLGHHARPVVFVDVGGYWKQLIGFLDHATQEGFVPLSARSLILHADTVANAMSTMSRHLATQMLHK